MLMYGRNQHNVVKQLSANKKKKDVSKDKANQGALPLYGLPWQPKIPSDPDIFRLLRKRSFNRKQKSCKFCVTNEGLKSELIYLTNIKFVIGELFFYPLLQYPNIYNSSVKTEIPRRRKAQLQSASTQWNHS